VKPSRYNEKLDQLIFFNSRKKLFSVLIIAILAGLQILLTGPASAASTYSMTFVNTVNDESQTFSGGESILGLLQIDLPAIVDTNSSVLLTLPATPSGYSWDEDFAYSIPANIGSAKNVISTVSLTEVSATTLKLEITGLTAGQEGGAGRVFIGFNSAGPSQSTVTSGLGVHIPSSADGEVNLTLSAPSNSIFTSGTVVIAEVVGTRSVTLATESATTIGESGGSIGEVTIKEDSSGSLYDPRGNNLLKFTLPSGFTWDLPATMATAQLLWGDPGILANLNVELQNGDRDFCMSNSTYETTDPVKLRLDLHVKVDESVVKPGPIMFSIKGSCPFKFGGPPLFSTYGTYNLTVTAKDTPTIFAGKDEQEIGDIVIKEDLEGTLVEGRTVTLTLPAGARFQQVYEGAGDLDGFDSDEGLDLEFTAFTGTDERTAKFTVQKESDDAAEIALEDIEVAVEAGFEGDLVVTVGGSAGVSGSVIVAKVVAPITAKAVSIPNVIIGLGGQAGGSFTITETAAESFDKDGTKVELDLPGGLTFTKTPKVEVTSGDLRIGNVRRANGDNTVWFDIEAESSEPSTVTISDVSLKIDRSVAEGDISLKVQGDAIVETDAFADWTNSDFAAKFAVAKVVTPAPGETKYTTVFKIGDMKYTVNGLESFADVAPYIKGDRTMLPIRYTALAAGVLESSILWNGSDQSVILIKGDRIVKLVIGSTMMTINGVAFPLDTASEIVDPGRVMLPMRAVAQALGCTVQWDAATQSVTIS
jgi:hypothetical protein